MRSKFTFAGTSSRVHPARPSVVRRSSISRTYRWISGFIRRIINFVFHLLADAAGGQLNAGQFHHIVFSRRNTSNQISTYLDGQLIFTVDDPDGNAIISAANRLTLFQDDEFTRGSEDANGAVDFVRVYDGPLDDNNAAVLAARALGTAEPGGVISAELRLDIDHFESNEFSSATPTNDQRGIPRSEGSVSEGSVSSGAFEFQAPETMRVDTLDGTSDGYYAQGQLSLADAVDWANKIPGHDTIALSDDFVNELRAKAADQEAADAVITLSATLKITDDLTIYGPGADLLAVSGNDQFRVLEIAADTTVNISGLTIRDGKTVNDQGGGVHNRGHLLLREVVIADNHATGDISQPDGGGLYNGANGTLTIIASTIYDNTATSDGGGIFNASDGALVVRNSTISSNAARVGGGIYAAEAQTSLNNVTMTKNEAEFNGGGLRGFGTVTYNNSILAENVAGTVGDNVHWGSTAVVSVTNSIVGGEPRLGALRDIGNGTPTHGLLPGSPAIGSADPATAEVVDQRGIVRPNEVAADIGAVRYETPDLTALAASYGLPNNTIVVDSLLGVSDGYFAAGEMSLGEAILFANNRQEHPEIDTITFLKEFLATAEDGEQVQSVIDASTERFTITDDLTLIGPGADKLRIVGSLAEVADASSLFSISPNTTVAVSGLTMSGNFAEHGGAFDNEGILNLDRVFITENRTSNSGGAIRNRELGTLTVHNSTLSLNSAHADGGGIANSGEAFLINTTVSGNEADGGGGLTNRGLMELKHVTISNNLGTIGGGFYNFSGATLQFGNSIIASNIPGSTGPEGFNAGMMVTLGGNLIGTNYDLFLEPHNTDLILESGDPNDPDMFETFLGELQNVGEFTIPVHPVLPNSPAKDLGIVANRVATDQRGEARPTLGGIDAGAFELQDYTWGSVLVVDSLADELDGNYGPGGLSLREALLWANFKDGSDVPSNAPDVITFDPTFVQSLVENLADRDVATNTFSLNSGTSTCGSQGGVPQCGQQRQLPINQNVIIVNPGSVLDDPITNPALFRISGTNRNRVFEIAEGITAEISGITIADGRRSRSFDPERPDTGGAILNHGNLTLRDVVVENSSSYGDGGGIYSDGMLQIERSTIRNNQSDTSRGGGIRALGPLLVDQSTFHDNWAHRGGGIYTTAETTIDRSALYDNEALKNGGALFNGDTPVVISNSTISANRTAGNNNGGNQNGGGIYTRNLELYHTTVAFNESAQRGGGIRSDGRILVYNSIVANNRAAEFNHKDLEVYANTSSHFESQFSLYSKAPSGAVNGVPVVLDATNLVDDPRLRRLGDNGGATWSHALDPLSPAIDAGNSMARPESINGLRLKDQRGLPLSDVKTSSRTVLVGDHLTFDDSAISLPNSVLDDNYRFMVQFNYRTTKIGPQSILSAANRNEANEFAIFFHDATTLRVIDRATVNDFTNLPSLADGEWHQISIVREGARNGHWLVIDGVSYGFQTVFVSTINLDVTSGGLFVGQNQDELGGNYQSKHAAVGDLDELRFWESFWPQLQSEAQEESNILAHVNQHADGPLIGNEPSLSAYYPFDQASPDSVRDAAGNRHGVMGDSVGNEARDRRPAPTRAFKAAVATSDFADMGAYEIQSVSSSAWRYEALGASQFGDGDAAVLGFGFDDGRGAIDPEPYFLGFDFDTGRKTYGGIATDPVFGTRWGGTATVDFDGRLGFDLGFYVNSGSVDVTYDGAVNYVVDATSNTNAAISTYVDVQDGSLYTISPKIGAYADLVVELDADVDVTGCVAGCVTANLLDINVAHAEEMFALNRQMQDNVGRALFFNHDDNDEPIAIDSSGSNNRYFDLDGQELDPDDFAEGNYTPIFDGDIRYFSLPVEEIATGATKAYNTVKEKIDDRRAASEVSDAENEFQRSSNRVSQLNDELEKAKEQMRNPKNGTAAEVVNARATVERLAGREYADAVRDGAEDNVAKRGEISEAVDASAAAHEKRKAVKEKFETRQREQERRNQKRRSPKAGVGIALSEAEGSVLGAQVDLEVGVTSGPFSASKNIGSLQVTLPDVNLKDTTVTNGRLSATTDVFAENSELDEKRQIANARVELATMLPVIGAAAGKMNLSAGPLSLDLTTISYTAGPQLNVSQDVAATPVANTFTYSFYDATQDVYDGDGMLISERSACVNVTISGQTTDGCVESVTFEQGSRIEVSTEGLGGIEGNAIRVQPTMNFEARFSNDIGLDLDLDGTFEAFGMSLSAFGQSIFNIDPLISHRHNLASFDVGSVFDRTWDLPAMDVSLASFTLFEKTMDGRTARTAYTTMETGVTNRLSKENIQVDAPSAVWIASEMVDANMSDHLYSVLDIEITGDAELSDLVALDASLTVTPRAEAGTFRITGFTPDMLSERSTSLFALVFSSPGSIDVQATRSAPLAIDVTPIETENVGGIERERFQLAGVVAATNLDIDQDGIASPLTDGVLLIRHLDSVTGEALIAGTVDIDRIVANDRTDRTAAEIESDLPSDIANYIDNVLIQSLLQDSDDPTSVRITLDLDGNGGKPDVTDSEILARYMARFSGDPLVAGLTEADPAEVLSFIETGRISASGINNESFGDVVNYTGEDVFGLSGVANAENNDGSSAAGAVESDTPRGASPEFAILGDHVQAADLPSAYEFMLEQYNQPVTFEELYLDGELVSRVAEGSPIDFGSEDYKSLINTGVSEDRIAKQAGTALLGSEEPIFVRVPDAAAYEYLSHGDFKFETIVIDPQVGGNLLLPSQFDLFLFSNGKWEFETTISRDNPDHVGVNGFLNYTFANGPVSQFRLFSHALPNTELHDADNKIAGEQTAKLKTTTGFLFSAGSGSPEVTMFPIAGRELLKKADPIVASPVSVDSVSFDNEFSIVRDEADIIVSLNGTVHSTFQLASTRRLDFIGGDNANDRLVLSSAGGPIHTPLLVDAGFRNDSLVVSTTHGNGLSIDLTDRDTLIGVETVDLRGTGANRLRLDVDSIVENDPFTEQMVVIANADDTVEIDAGWQWTGTTSVDIDGDSQVVELYQQGTARLFVASEATLVEDVDTVDAGENGLAQPTEKLAEKPLHSEPQNTPRIQVAFADVAETRENGPRANHLVGIGDLGRDGRVAAGDLPDNTQSITSDTAVTVTRNSTVAIPLAYDVSDAASTTGLHLRVHFDSSQLGLNSITEAFPEGFVAAQIVEDGPCTDNGGCIGLDGDADTDQYINLLWLDAAGNWPGDNRDLVQLNFETSSTINTTQINFTGNAAATSRLVAASIDLAFDDGPDGDINADGRVDVQDIDLLCEHWNSGNPVGDLTDDGIVDEADLRMIVEDILGTVSGDSNLDGAVDAVDLNAFGVHWLSTGELSWSQGNFNCDDRVDVVDLNRIGVNWEGGGAAMSHVPRALLSAGAAQSDSTDSAVRPVRIAQSANTIESPSRVSDSTTRTRNAWSRATHARRQRSEALVADDFFHEFGETGGDLWLGSL